MKITTQTRVTKILCRKVGIQRCVLGNMCESRKIYRQGETVCVRNRVQYVSASRGYLPLLLLLWGCDYRQLSQSPRLASKGNRRCLLLRCRIQERGGGGARCIPGRLRGCKWKSDFLTNTTSSRLSCSVMELYPVNLQFSERPQAQAIPAGRQ